MRKPERVTRAALTGPNRRPALDAMGEYFGVKADFPNIVELSVADLDPNPDQPRTVFDQAELQALAASLERHGQQQPILVQEGQGGRYTIVFGERRVRATKLLGRETIYAIVTKTAGPEIALIENVQRADLDAVDLAQSLERLSAAGYTQDEIGLLIGKDRSRIAKILSILSLPTEMLSEYQREFRSTVSMSALIELAQVGDPETRQALWDEVRQGLGLINLRAKRREAKEVQQEQAGHEESASGSTPERSSRKAIPVVQRGIEQSVKRISTEVERLGKHRPHLTVDHAQKLRDLRDAIDRLLSEQCV